MTAIAAVLAVATLIVILAVLPSDTPVQPVAADPAPGCAEWSDGCVVCRRTPDGPACSTPGIACTRGPLQCLTRS